MKIEKYKRWPQAMVEKNGKVWRRSQVKGWFDYVEYDNRATGGGYSCISRFLTHPEFHGSKQIWRKSEIPPLTPSLNSD